MQFLKTTTLTSAIALMAGPALADVSAADVWADWQNLMDGYGLNVSVASENASGGVLTVSGVTIGFEMPEGVFSMDLGDMTFEETGGGTVRVLTPETMPITMTIDTEEGEEVSIAMSLSQSGGEMIVSGDPAALRYDFSYPTLGFGEFEVSGDEMPAEFPMVFDMTLSDTTGFMALQEGNNRPYDSVVSSANLVADLSVDVPESEGGGAFALSFNIADLSQTTSGTLGTIEMDMSAAEMINGGMSQVGRATHGAATYTIDVDGPDGAFTMQAGADSGSLDMVLNDAGISYGTSANNATMSLAGDMIPLPAVNLAMTETGGTFTMPLVPGDEPQDFGLVMRMVGLEIDDMIWGLFDPAGQLPRDPATLIVDLGGKAILTEDITSPEFAESDIPTVPGSLEAITVNALQLSLAGAELTGTGDFEVDNSMGIPMPAGKANLMLTGGNTLIDTLVGMGLVPEEQAMGARMMLGMFARPGAGEDTLTSEIEVTKDGQVLANGQRIR